MAAHDEDTQRNIDMRRANVALVLNAMSGQACREEDRIALLRREDDALFAENVAHDLAHAVATLMVNQLGREVSKARLRECLVDLARMEAQA